MMNRRPLPTIEANAGQIEPLEPRLALSASLAGDLLLEALSPEVLGPEVLGPEVLGPEPLGPEPLGQEPLGQESGRGQEFSLDSSGMPEGEAGHGAPDLLSQAADLRAEQQIDGRGQTVAVIDSGVAWDHVAFGGGYGPGYRVVGGWDFAESDSNPYDDGPAGYHGTHVAGILAGYDDSFAGIATGADIVSLRVFDDQGVGQLEWIEDSLAWVHQNQDAFGSPITTVNLSIGAALTDANREFAMTMLEDELQLLRDDNILVFAASGNLFGVSSEYDSGVLYPASSPSVIPVASVDNLGQLSEFAQRESGVYAASGESIGSAVPDHVFGWDGNVDDFARLSGTSMASPQVAGASMLIRQAMLEQGLDPSAGAILEHLESTSVTQVDPLTGHVYHTIDLHTAIESIAPQSTTIDQFHGTNDGEEITLDLRTGVELSVGGITYQLDTGSSIAPLVIDVGGGDDALHIIGSENAERLIVQPPTAGENSSLSTNQFRIELRGFENVLFDGGGGPDKATLFDSSGSDRLSSTPGEGTLSGVGFRFEVTGVPAIYVHGTAGGTDIAFLHDSPGNDSLAVRPDFTSLRSDGEFQLAYGFERVYAYSDEGGQDTAKLYDSLGDDTMSISPIASMITGPGYKVTAKGFDTVEGDANAGGIDTARIYADQTDARWDAAPDRLQWTGQDDAVRIARGFEHTEAFEQFEPVDLTPQSAQVQLMPWLEEDDPEQRARRESDALQRVFEDFGQR